MTARWFADARESLGVDPKSRVDGGAPVRRNFDVEDLVGTCRYCRSFVRAEHNTSRVDVCLNCERDDQREYSGFDNSYDEPMGEEAER